MNDCANTANSGLLKNVYVSKPKPQTNDKTAMLAALANKRKGK
jgi:hypothetical protein